MARHRIAPAQRRGGTQLEEFAEVAADEEVEVEEEHLPQGVSLLGALWAAYGLWALGLDALGAPDS